MGARQRHSIGIVKGLITASACVVTLIGAGAISHEAAPPPAIHLVVPAGDQAIRTVLIRFITPDEQPDPRQPTFPVTNAATLR